MGLDMFVNTTGFKPESEVDFVVPDGQFDTNEIGYFRKANFLQGWMHELYLKKGGKRQDFNCSNLQLTKKDLLQLIKDYCAGKLKPVDGFFFGSQNVSDYHIQDMFSMIGKAFIALKNGETVYYSAWY